MALRIAITSAFLQLDGLGIELLQILAHVVGLAPKLALQPRGRLAPCHHLHGERASAVSMGHHRERERKRCRAREREMGHRET
jgi:hypothetical protein